MVGRERPAPPHWLTRLKSHCILTTEGMQVEIVEYFLPQKTQNSQDAYRSRYYNALFRFCDLCAFCG